MHLWKIPERLVHASKEEIDQNRKSQNPSKKRNATIFKSTKHFATNPISLSFILSQSHSPLCSLEVLSLSFKESFFPLLCFLFFPYPVLPFLSYCCMILNFLVSSQIDLSFMGSFCFCGWSCKFSVLEFFSLALFLSPVVFFSFFQNTSGFDFICSWPVFLAMDFDLNFFDPGISNMLFIPPFCSVFFFFTSLSFLFSLFFHRTAAEMWIFYWVILWWVLIFGNCKPFWFVWFWVNFNFLIHSPFAASHLFPLFFLSLVLKEILPFVVYFWKLLFFSAFVFESVGVGDYDFSSLGYLSFSDYLLCFGFHSPSQNSQGITFFNYDSS